MKKLININMEFTFKTADPQIGDCNSKTILSSINWAAEVYGAK
jgi:hypothetical protein